MEWINKYAPECEGCRAMYRGRIPAQEPPCEDCRVELLPKNKKTAEVYMLCRRQYITTAEGQVVGISIPAIDAVMNIYGVENRRECLERVTMLFYHFESKK